MMTAVVTVNGTEEHLINTEDDHDWGRGSLLSAELWRYRSAAKNDGLATDAFLDWFGNGPHDYNPRVQDWYLLSERFDLDALDASWVEAVELDNGETAYRSLTAAEDAWDDYMRFDRFEGVEPSSKEEAHAMLVTAGIRN
jgi:hypothetical protein